MTPGHRPTAVYTTIESRPGESTEDYRARLRRLAFRPTPVRPLRGYVSDRDGVKPWWRAASTRVLPEDWERVPSNKRQHLRRLDEQAKEFDARLEQELKASVPPPVKRTPQERLKSLTDRLVEDAERLYDLHGRFVLPHSVMEEIIKEMASHGQFVTPAKLERMARDEIRPLLEQRARRLMEEAARRVGNDRSHEVRSVND